MAVLAPTWRQSPVDGIDIEPLWIELATDPLDHPLVLCLPRAPNRVDDLLQSDPRLVDRSIGEVRIRCTDGYLGRLELMKRACATWTRPRSG
jgi:hypothetical protein